MKYDLHTHTNFSDGDLSIEGNVEEALKKGLDGIAISDHDNIETWKLISNNNYKIKVIKAVELSTNYKGASVHILGYYLNNGKPYKELEDFLVDMKNKREKRVLKIIELLKNQNIFITYEDVKKHSNGIIARPHIAKTIMDKYPEYSFQEVFELFIGDDKPCYVQTSNLTTEEAIKILHNNNCLAVLAHPLQIKNIDYKEVMELDIDGVECFYPYEEEKESDEVIRLAKEKGLLLTGGSDFHGPITRNTIGLAYLEDEYLQEFLKRINLMER